jgi:predicted signal transduction protein with EAL and GGDEF domain
MQIALQPIVDTERDCIVAYEALARWHSPQLGWVVPDEFIRAAEHGDMISSITPTLLRKALTAARDWPEHISLSFNLSAHDIASIESIEAITRVVAESGVLPERVEFEITETSLIVDYEQAVRALKSLKVLGVRVSLDDFGAGHSSLGHLHRLPIDKVKIDRSFVRDIANDELSREIVKTVLLLCRSRGLPCVVEGVETAEQKRVLTDLDGRLMQGNLFGAPVLASELDAYGHRHRAARSAA